MGFGFGLFVVGIEFGWLVVVGLVVWIVVFDATIMFEHCFVGQKRT